MTTLAYKNANPGNIKDPNTGTFKQFSSPGEGYGALLNDLQAKKEGRTSTGLGPQSTLVEFAEKYAPESDNNNPGQYAANIANFMGVRPDSTIGELDTGKWAEAVSWAEDHKYAETQGISPTADRQQSGYQTSAPLPERPQVQEPVEKPGVLQGLSQDISGRFGTIGEAATGVATGQINPLRGLLRIGGGIAGGVGDVIGAGVSALTPDFIEEPVSKAVGKGVQGLMSTSLGQKATAAYQSIDPEIQKDLEAVGNIATAVPAVKGVGIAAKGAKGAIPAAKRAVAGTSGIAGEAARRSLVNEALEIVAPKDTQKTLKAAIKSGRATPGSTFSKAAISEDARTIRAAEAAAGIVQKGKTGIENANRVRSEIGKTAQKLESDIEKLDIVPIVQKEDLDGLFKSAMDDIGENPTMVGNAEKSAERIINKFKSFLPEGDVTAIDILRARKKLDRWIENLEGGGRIFDPSYENAKSIALRAIRQGANDLVDIKAPSVPVKELLARQSALYDALENIAVKATKEVGTTGLQRSGLYPVVTGALKEGAKAGLIGLGIGGTATLLDNK